MIDNTRTSVLGNLIGSGEGGYYSFNRGVAGDSPGQELNPNITVGEIMRRQQLSYTGPDQLFAVGKYQMIGPHNGDPPDPVGTFKRAVDALGISPNEVFTPDLQEKMFANYLITSKRPEINDYITGVTQGASGLQKAQVALAQEFASVGDPTNGGKSYYDNDKGGNAASIRPEEAANALNQMRERYVANKQNGLSDTAAYDALRDQPVSQQSVAQTTSAPSRDYLKAGDAGQRVEVLQQALNANGARLTVDGDFGNATRAAVENYQRANHLTVDGVAGREVFKSLGISNEQTQGATNAATQAALAGVQGLNTTGARETVSGALAAADVAKGAVKQTEPARDIGADIAATARDWAGRNFKPGETERCQDFVNSVLNSTHPGLADKIGTTRQAVDGLESGELLASRFFGKDVSKPVTDLSQAKPGDIVGFANTYGNYAPGTITHVGIYVGDGMVVDRPTSDRPVQLRSIKTFGDDNFVIMRPNAYEQIQSQKTGVESQTQTQTQTQSANIAATDTSLLRQGDSGMKVDQLQRQLQQKGFDPGQIDGQFGPKTEAAVKAFQAANGLETDGIVGPLSRAQLAQPVHVASQPATHVAPDTQSQIAAKTIVDALAFAKPNDGINKNDIYKNDGTPFQFDKLNLQTAATTTPSPTLIEGNEAINKLFKQAMSGIENTSVPNKLDAAALAVQTISQAPGFKQDQDISIMQGNKGLIVSQGEGPASVNVLVPQANKGDLEKVSAQMTQSQLPSNIQIAQVPDQDLTKQQSARAM